MERRADDLVQLVSAELSRVVEPNRRTDLASLFVAPVPLQLGWNYGEEGARFNCWQVGQSRDGGVLLVYCDQGFGPAFPWGFIFPEEDSLGMDCQWHSGLEDAAINAGLIAAPSGYEVPGPRT